MRMMLAFKHAEHDNKLQKRNSTDSKSYDETTTAAYDPSSQIPKFPGDLS
mgnify:CR=1 FL=1